MNKDNPHKTTDFAEKAAQLTTDPGVYLMKDRRGSVMYVGKAKSLKNRVRSYFQRSRDATQKTKLMVSKIADFETIITPTEKDALILENNLIKKYRPRFNVLFRDDKEFPYLKLSTQEPFPNLTVVRKPKKDGALYFGPFSSAQSVRETLKVVHKIFPIRKCSRKRLKQERPCMYHELGQCPAPCSRPVSSRQYHQTVTDVRLFLEGRSSSIVSELKRRMQQESRHLNFEAAARIRDQISAIEQTLEKQTVVCRDRDDRDIFSFFRDGSRMTVTVLFVRSGRMTGSRNFHLRKLELSDQEVLSSFVGQYYYRGEYIPREILIPFSFEDMTILEDWLREKRTSAVRILFPRRGFRKDLVTMASRNAEIVFHQDHEREEQVQDVLADLHKRLQLTSLPLRIACFDISNIMGTSAVGSMVVFEEGKPVKDAYRKFRIKTVDQPNDYAMMYEVLSRQLAKKQDESPSPDLIVVDGGKGQLGILCKALHDHDRADIGACALAKIKQQEQEQEKVFIPGRKNPVHFPPNAPGLLLLQRVRDEAHRFAVTYYRELKKKKDFTSSIEHVPGVGKKSVAAVLKHFGSMEQARQATLEQLEQVPAMTKRRAADLYAFFHCS